MSMQAGARSESAYRDMLDSLPSMVWLIDDSGECLFQNEATLHFTGQSLRQEQSEDWRKRASPEDVYIVEKSIAAAFEENAEKSAEFRYRDATGEYRWMRATIAPMNGKFKGRATLLVILSDISADRAALELQQRTARDRAMELGRANQALKQTLDVLATEPDLNNVLGHVLTVMTMILQGTSSTLWLKNQREETATLHLAYQNNRVVAGLESGHRLAGQKLDLNRADLFALAVFRLRRPVWHEVAKSPALDDTARDYLSKRGAKALLGIPLILGDQPIGSIVVRFAKSREFGSAEIELAQGLAEQATLAWQLTRLAEQAQKAAVTEERNRLAREIHDTLAQSFAGILIQVRAAKQIMNGDKPEIVAHLDSAMNLALTGLSEARRSVKGLRPQLLRDGGIVHALEQLVNQLSGESHMKIHLNTSGDVASLASDIESNVLRLTQEAITNAIRHSGGSRIHVKLSMNPEILKLMIDDDGDGFDPHISTLNRGFGLVSMQERAERIGGDLTILTKPGAGTKLHLLVPLTRPKKSEVAHR
ncbi:MAG: histidine kinase [Candidatus Acidiferrales bacterium]